VNAARLNATLAVEFDHVSLERLRWTSLTAERLAEIRLSAAIYLCPRIELAEALLSGVPVPIHRLDPGWVRALNLTTDVVLDDELALRVNAHGPLERRDAR
jgi:hypothetical protein